MSLTAERTCLLPSILGHARLRGRNGPRGLSSWLPLLRDVFAPSFLERLDATGVYSVVVCWNKDDHGLIDRDGWRASVLANL